MAEIPKEDRRGQIGKKKLNRKGEVDTFKKRYSDGVSSKFNHLKRPGFCICCFIFKSPHWEPFYLNMFQVLHLVGSIER